MTREKFNQAVNLQGVLFKNKIKKKEKSADYYGHIKIQNKMYFLSGWENSCVLTLRAKVFDEKYIKDTSDFDAEAANDQDQP